MGTQKQSPWQHPTPVATADSTVAEQCPHTLPLTPATQEPGAYILRLRTSQFQPFPFLQPRLWYSRVPFLLPSQFFRVQQTNYEWLGANLISVSAKQHLTKSVPKTTQIIKVYAMVQL